LDTSADKLRVKLIKTAGLVRGQGYSNFLLKPGLVGAKRGKILQPVVLINLQGKGHVRQRSLSADLIFGSFHQGKEHNTHGKLSAMGLALRQISMLGLSLGDCFVSSQ